VAKDWDALSVDFAAIRTLRVVFDQASFSKAAELLGVNQSTISYTMDRLREAFHDPLFVRQGSGIAPTHRCVEIVERAGRLLDEFEALVASPKFDPAEATDTVTIACNYYEQCIIFPRIVQDLRRVAPNVMVVVTPATHQGMAYLKRGQTDLLIGPYDVDNESFYHRHLLTDHYVCVMDKQHVLSGKTLNLDDYLNANHAVVTYGGNWRSPYQIELERRSLDIKRKFSVPSLSDLVDILPGTDLISTIPSRMSEQFGPAFCVAACPIIATFQLGLVWTSRTQHSAVHRWVRQLIIEACTRMSKSSKSAKVAK
jgi:DNA-binding transcriptional LysR family regulator